MTSTIPGLELLDPVGRSIKIKNSFVDPFDASVLYIAVDQECVVDAVRTPSGRLCLFDRRTLHCVDTLTITTETGNSFLD